MLLASAGLTTALWPGPGWHDGKWLWTSQSDDFRRSSIKITNDMAVTKIGILVAAVVRLYFRGQFFLGSCFFIQVLWMLFEFLLFHPQNTRTLTKSLQRPPLCFQFVISALLIWMDIWPLPSLDCWDQEFALPEFVVLIIYCLNFCFTYLLMGGWSFMRSCGF